LSDNRSDGTVMPACCAARVQKYSFAASSGYSRGSKDLTIWVAARCDRRGGTRPRAPALWAGCRRFQSALHTAGANRRTSLQRRHTVNSSERFLFRNGNGGGTGCCVTEPADLRLPDDGEKVKAIKIGDELGKLYAKPFKLRLPPAGSSRRLAAKPVIESYWSRTTGMVSDTAS